MATRSRELNTNSNSAATRQLETILPEESVEMRRIRLISLLFMVTAGVQLPAQNSPEVEQLLELLVAKNVITSADAAQYRATLKAKSAADSAPTVTPASNLARTAKSPAAQVLSTPPATSKIPGFSRDTLTISGYVQGRFTEAPKTTNTFEIRRARLIFDGNLTDTLSYQVQLDGVKPQLLDARLDFKPVKQFGVTIGQFKIPFSTESYLSDNLLPFVERSAFVNRFAPGRDNGNNGRDIGLQFSGRLLHSRNVDHIQYFAGVFNGSGINSKDDNHYKDTAARLIVSPVKQLAVAGNYYNGSSGVKELSRERADLEVSFSHGPFSTAAEYLWGHDGPIHRRGWYAESVYRVDSRWEAVFRFDKFDPRQHTSSVTALNNYVIGTNYLVNSYVKLQANYDRQQDLIAQRSANVVLLQTQFQFGGERSKQ
jgi:phosphate-selective porin